MTTQAQIDAAMWAYASCTGDHANRMTLALAAAAEVGEKWTPDIHGTKSEIWDTAVAQTKAKLKAAEFAAKHNFDGWQQEIKRSEELEAATIERCAQVAKKFIEGLIDPKSKTMWHWDEIRSQVTAHLGSDLPRLNFESLIETIAEDAAAAIRALKEEKK